MASAEGPGASGRAGEARGAGVASDAAETNEQRRQQLQGHTSALWKILDDVCDHSTLGPEALDEATGRINNLKKMDVEIDRVESELASLHTLYHYESKAYLGKLRAVEDATTSASPAGQDPSDSFGQAALERSFAKRASAILYDDGDGTFQLVAAKVAETKASDGAGA